MTAYRTIVADPPWDHSDGYVAGPGGRQTRRRETRALPYPPMPLADIRALDVRSLADPSGCRLFLWTTNRYLRAAFDVMSDWGFTYKQTLTWHKTPDGAPFVTHIAPSHSEFILVGVIGKPGRIGAFPSSVIAQPNASGGGHRRHSAKPDTFLDYIEMSSPAPWLELFSRRSRFGWDYRWHDGDRVACHTKEKDA